MRFIDHDEVAKRLTYDVCIPIVRDAMMAFSKGQTRQLLRTAIPLADGRLFFIMPGALGETAAFGAKLLSVFPQNPAHGRPSHQGIIALFDPSTGEPVCILDAGAVTAIRTGAASAVATDALARPAAHTLAIAGYGHQAETHARAISKVRDIQSIRVWGRSPERAEAFCARMRTALGLPVTSAANVAELVRDADIVCTVTSAREPILNGAWVRPGTHVNVVGSSIAGPVEVDNELVARSRFFVDSREGVMRQGSEFLNAKEAGLIGDDHIVAEIGQVLAGDVAGRGSDDEITMYKSLGHVVQDLASASALYSGASAS